MRNILLNNFTKLFFLASSLFFLPACDSREEEINFWESKSEIRLSVYYISEFTKDTIPDVGAKIYFYYNFNGADISQYDTYHSDGILRNRYKEDKIIKSDTVGFVPESGTFVLDNIDKNIDDIVMVIESKHYDSPAHRMTVYALFLKTSNQPRIFKSYFRENSWPEFLSSSSLGLLRQ